MVSAASMVCMAISLAISAGGPVIVFFVLRHRLRVQAIPVMVGALVFLVFTQLLEKTLHVAVFEGFPQITRMPLVYALYASLAAAAFEEVGRACGFLVLRRARKTRGGLPQALGYGIGHGGIEAILIGGLGSLSALTVSATLNGMGREALLARVPEASSSTLAQQISALASTAPPMFLISGVERAIAFSIQIALSVLVWMVVSGRVRRTWLGGAILLHTLCDFGSGLAQTGAIPSLMAEVWAFVAAAVTVVLVTRLWRVTGHRQEADRSATPEGESRLR